MPRCCVSGRTGGERWSRRCESARSLCCIHERQHVRGAGPGAVRLSAAWSGHNVRAEINLYSVRTRACGGQSKTAPTSAPRQREWHHRRTCEGSGVLITGQSRTSAPKETCEAGGDLQSTTPQRLPPSGCDENTSVSWTQLPWTWAKGLRARVCERRRTTNTCSTRRRMSRFGISTVGWFKNGCKNDFFEILKSYPLNLLPAIRNTSCEYFIQIGQL